MRIFPIDKDTHIQTLGEDRDPICKHTSIQHSAHNSTSALGFRILSFPSLSPFPLPSFFPPPNSSFFLFSSIFLFPHSSSFSSPPTIHCRPVVAMGSDNVLCCKYERSPCQHRLVYARRGTPNYSGERGGGYSESSEGAF